MKRIVLILFLIFVSSCSKETSLEQEFVNPLFYETLDPISRMAWKTNLSPTQITKENAGYIETINCELIKNTQESITLKCKEGDKLQLTYLYTYTIRKPVYDGSSYYKGIRVREEVAKPNEDWFSRSSFAILDK